MSMLVFALNAFFLLLDASYRRSASKTDVSLGNNWNIQHLRIVICFRRRFAGQHLVLRKQQKHQQNCLAGHRAVCIRFLTELCGVSVFCLDGFFYIDKKFDGFFLLMLVGSCSVILVLHFFWMVFGLIFYKMEEKLDLKGFRWISFRLPVSNHLACGCEGSADVKSDANDKWSLPRQFLSRPRFWRIVLLTKTGNSLPSLESLKFI